jgi:5'-3' exoribonuclease 2
MFKYFLQGCPSWNWFYPFHYAPFASDLVNIDRVRIDFELSHPFSPVEQLLSVLPAASAHALPPCMQFLMLDDDSPLKDIYVEDAPLDPNGKHLPWRKCAE